jgi:hypothetical protein
MPVRKELIDADSHPESPPMAGAPSFRRFDIALRLFAILVVGSIVMAALAGGTFISISVDRYQTPLNLASTAVRGAYLMAWIFCAIGLVIVAAICLWRRARGHRSWRYGGALGVAFLAMLVVWFVPSFTMSLNTPRAGGTVVGNIVVALVMWLLTSFYAMFFNLANLLFVVPAIIEAWYAVLNRGTPHEDPTRVVWKRRAWLYAMAIASLLLIGWIGG